MHSRRLLHFLAVVDHHGITAAANVLHISQPALTKSIRQLEESLGVKLFDRLPTGVVPTRFGDILARRVRLMHLEYDHAVAEIKAMQGGTHGTISLGAGPVWMVRFLPPAIAELCRQRPGIQVKLTSGVINTLVPALLGGEIDLVCSTLDFPNHPEVVKEHLVDVSHVVVARLDHPLASSRAVSARELIAYPWVVLRDDQVGRSRLGSFFAANNLRPPRIAVESTSTTHNLNILKESDFLAHIPDPMMPIAEALGLVKLPIKGTFWHSSAGIAYRATQNPLPAVNALRAILRATFAARS